MYIILLKNVVNNLFLTSEEQNWKRCLSILLAYICLALDFISDSSDRSSQMPSEIRYVEIVASQHRVLVVD